MREDFGMLVVAEARDKGKDTVDGNVVAQHERDGQILSYFDLIRQKDKVSVNVMHKKQL